MDDDEMEAMNMALVHYGLGLGIGLRVWHAGTSRVAFSLLMERGVDALYLLVGRRPL